MKIFRILGTLALVLAGIALLWAPAHAQANAAKAFTPTRFTVVDEGTVGKPDVVLIPGLTSSREVWAGEAAKLAPNYRLHLVQIDGFAGQPAGPNATGPLLQPIVTELHEYIAASGMRPVVMGHSLGGLLTLMLADKYPADVRKMVIVDSLPFYGMLFGPTATVEAIQPQAAKIRDGLIAATPDERKAGAQKAAESLATDPAGRKLVEKNSEDSDASVFARAMYEDLQTDLRGDVAGIKTPTLMLYPYDPAFGQDASRVDALYQGAYKPMPDAKVERIDASRHFIMLDQPEKFDAAVEAFLR
ncbi:MAG TPA: alpha/beta hydrolase [Acidobacteriaceae bacterium]|jgi:pimeloyl-ACP methyl ester carboxylesterase|nr:alpha/beta hydrolase [Acidobacteriaceae bacterium]